MRRGGEKTGRPMTYQQLRTLLACLARFDGRLSVLTARSQEPFEQWAVCLCDHVRQTWRCVGGLDALTAPAQGRARAPRERPLAKLLALPQPHGATLTWL